MDQHRLYLILCMMYCNHYSQADLPFVEMSVNSKFYFLIERTVNETYAAAQCDAQRLGELAFFETNDEYLSVGEHLTTYFHDPKRADLCVWIAINATVNIASNQYEHWWQNESLHKSIWALGEPDSVCLRPSGEKCCVRMSWQNASFNALRDRVCSDDNCYYLCKSVNECQVGKHNCSQLQICVDKDFGFECVCKQGYNLTVDGRQCVDVDECLWRPCDHLCNNVPGSFNCRCHRGYNLNADGLTCQDIDECALEECNHTCTNFNGSYECTCFLGFLLAADNFTCTDLDECASREPPCQQHCLNEEGAFSCRCDSGYTLTLDNKTCAVVDYCRDDPCPGHCVNTAAGYLCGCPNGFEEVGTQCVDVDECTRGIHNCSHDCQNTDGSYNCTCRPGYTMSANDIHTCIDTDECVEETDKCNQTCFNADGSYSCSCTNGYSLDQSDKASCIDVNECEDQQSCQHRCNNMPGTFSCSCLAGYLLQEDGLSCIQTSEPYECPCNCHARELLSNFRSELFKQHTQAKQRNISINKNAISSAFRKKSSILNTNPTEAAVGGSGVAIVVVVFSLIVLLDVLNVVKYILFKYDRHKIQKLKPTKF